MRETPFSWTGGRDDRLSVKVRWVDFISLAFIHHFLSHCCTAERAVWSLCIVISGVGIMSLEQPVLFMKILFFWQKAKLLVVSELLSTSTGLMEFCCV